MTRSPSVGCVCASLGALLAAAASGHAQTLLGPLPYLSQADSPLDLSGLGATAFLEDFEDGHNDVPGAHFSTGAVVDPGPLTDSVDGDDGVIDGSGAGGHSYFSADGPTGIRVKFHEAEIGGLPASAGIVWTDGGQGCTVRFEAFGPGGASIGVISDPNAGDAGFNGLTAEDRFFGVEYSKGISGFRISCDSGGIEIDHLQWSGLVVQGCPADCTGDGVLDLFDFLCFVNDFNGSGDYSDCDGDKAHTLFDFLCFVNTFNAGC